jgi:hypothetical protein
LVEIERAGRAPTGVIGEAGSKIFRVDFASGDRSPGLYAFGTGRLEFAAVASRVEWRVAANLFPLVPEVGPLDLEVGFRVGIKTSGRVRVAALSELHAGGYPPRVSTFGASAGAAITLCWTGSCRSLISAAVQASAGEFSDNVANDESSPIGRDDSTVAGSASLVAVQAIGPVLSLFAVGQSVRSFVFTGADAGRGGASPELLEGTVGLRVEAPRSDWRNLRPSLSLGASFARVVSLTLANSDGSGRIAFFGATLALAWGGPAQ